MYNTVLKMVVVLYTVKIVYICAWRVTLQICFFDKLTYPCSVCACAGARARACVCNETSCYWKEELKIISAMKHSAGQQVEGRFQ
jgi:hypothetical protein